MTRQSPLDPFWVWLKSRKNPVLAGFAFMVLFAMAFWAVLAGLAYMIWS